MDIQRKPIDGISPGRNQRPLNQRGNIILTVTVWLMVLAGLVGTNFYVVGQEVDNATEQKVSALRGDQTAFDQALKDFAKQKALSVNSDGQLILDGQLQLNNGAVLDPSSEPISPHAGQIYLSQTDGLIYYYDGSKFVALATNSQAASAGTPGESAVSAIRTGVLSLQGVSGDLSLTAGGGIAINGLRVSNAGVTSLHAGTGVQLSGVSGDIAIGLPQNIAPSASPSFQGLTLVSALGVGSGGTGAATASAARANLLAAGSGANSDITSITGLTTALSVAQGGTGAQSFPSGAVLVGNNAGAVTYVSSSGAGKCLVSTNDNPTFQTCPSGSSGVVAGTPQASNRLTKFAGVNEIVNSLIGDDGTQIFGFGDLLLTPSGNSNTAFEVQNGSSVALLTANTNTMTVTVKNLNVAGHIVSSGSTPGIAVDPTAGTGGSPSCDISGTDVAGSITLVTGASGADLNGPLCNVTFAFAYGATPHIMVVGNDSDTTAHQPYVVNKTTFGFGFGFAQGISGNHTYTLDYFVIQ